MEIVNRNLGWFAISEPYTVAMETPQAAVEAYYVVSTNSFALMSYLARLQY